MGSPFKLLPAPKFQLFKIHKVNHYLAGSAIIFLILIHCLDSDISGG